MVGGRTRSNLVVQRQQQRLAIMKSDTRIKVLEAYRVQCAGCEAWVKLRRETPYAVQNWRKHIEGCERRRG